MANCVPPPVDCQILQFKQLCKLKICADLSKNTYLNPSNLVATSSLYGLTFVGEQHGIKIIITSKIFENNQGRLNPKHTIKSYLHRNIPLPSAPSHIDINSDQQFLCVTFNKHETPFLQIFQIRTLFDSNPVVFSEVRLSSISNTFVTDLSWNPAISNMLTCCISDRTLSVYTFNSNGSFEMKSLPKDLNSMCVCWSPKGKQLVVGNYNGYLTQYLPELRAMKNYPPPANIFDKPCSLCSVRWLSNFQFIGLYKLQTPNEEDGDSKTSVIVINTPKTEPVTYINYEDICFSSGTERPCQFYFIHIAAWNMIFAASSNAVEVSVLKMNADSVNWCQWMLEDSARITLPMSGVNETFPVGIAVDYSAPVQAPIGDNFVPMPVISVLTCEGVLCMYVVQYLEQSAPNICVKPSVEPQLQYFTNKDVTQEEEEILKSIQGTVFVANETVDPAQAQNFSIKSASNVTPPRTTTASDTTTVAQKTSAPPMLGASVNLSNFSRLASPAVDPSLRPNAASPNAMPLHVNQKADALKTQTTTNSSSPISKSALQAKARLECLKKFKNLASTFENDIKEIQGLVDNISVESDPFVLSNSRLKELDEDAKRLNKLKSEISSDVDAIKISLVEVFACIQDIKTKYFQLTNPGYCTLFGAQELDPVNATNLKHIENSINYVESQLGKANLQLDEFWCKFTEHSSPAGMKIPVLDNVFETMIRQQKILKILELQTEKIQKRIAAFKCLVKSNQWIQNEKNLNTLSNHFLDDITLAEFTQKALTIKGDFSISETVSNDAKMLAQKYSLEHASRFHISNAKQLKLQELHNSIAVTYIQSSRLQRLKKKSLILLSKSAYATESATEDDAEAASVAFSLPVQKDAKEFHLQLHSPVSSEGDDGLIDQGSSVLEYPTSLNLVSSTPVKSIAKNITANFAGEPSISVDVCLPLPATIKTPVSVSTLKTDSNRLFASSSISSVPIQSVPTVVHPINVNPPLATSSTTPTGNVSNTESAKLFTSATSNDMPSFSFLKGLSSSTSVSTTSSVSKSIFSGQITISPVSGTGISVTSAPPPFHTQSLFSKNLTTASATPASSLFSNTPSGISSSGTTSSSFFSNAVVTSPLTTAATSAAPVSIFSGGKQAESGGTLFGSNTTAAQNPGFATVRVSAFSSLANSNVGAPSTLASSSKTTVSSPASFGKTSSTNTGSSVLNSVTSVPVISSGPSTIFSGTGTSTGPIFGKVTSTSANSINFGSALPPMNSFFGSKTTQQPVVELSATSDEGKTSQFGNFSVTSSNIPATTSVTVTELPDDDKPSEGADADKENNVAASPTVHELTTPSTGSISTTSTFSFASISSAGFTPVKTSLFSATPTQSAATTAAWNLVGSANTAPAAAMPVATAAWNLLGTANTEPVAAKAGSSENTTLLSNILSSPPAAVVSSDNVSGGSLFKIASPQSVIGATAPAPTVSPPSAVATIFPVTSAPAAAAAASAIELVTPVPSPTPVISAAASAEATATTTAIPNAFENKGSFFEGLSLGAPTTTSAGTSSIFGKPAAGNSSVFGGNIFGQNATPSTTATETKSVFGSSSIFGSSNTTANQNRNLFGAASSGSFADNRTSTFGSSSLFGSGSTFGSGGTNAALQASNSFNSGSGGMLFSGSGANNFSSSSSLFPSNTASGFGSPTTFSSGLQQTQTASAFGSPPSFPSTFNKAPTFSAFGSAPTFGGSPTFGDSPTKVFGQPASNQASFGGATGQQTSTFENLSNENTMTFGNLAQQQQPSGFGSPPSFGTSSPQQPSFGQPGFGGSSFSSWR